jgi:hypothetical protein
MWLNSMASQTAFLYGQSYWMGWQDWTMAVHYRLWRKCEENRSLGGAVDGKQHKEFIMHHQKETPQVAFNASQAPTQPVAQVQDTHNALEAPVCPVGSELSVSPGLNNNTNSGEKEKSPHRRRGDSNKYMGAFHKDNYNIKMHPHGRLCSTDPRARCLVATYRNGQVVVRGSYPAMLRVPEQGGGVV